MTTKRPAERRKKEPPAKTASARQQVRIRDLAEEIEGRRQTEERVKSLLQRLVTVQEEERRRIARNLHDHLGQKLTALRLSIGALKEHTLSPEELRDRLDAIDKIASQIDRDVDYLAWDLRPAALDDVGLQAALATLISEWSGAQDIRAEFHVSVQGDIRLTGEVESHLYRIVQEALNNVAKHASATHVSVLLERRDHHVIATVEDDGCGFDVEAAATARAAERGMGLLSMQERAALVGGALEVESSPGKGTTLFVRMPIHPAIARRMARKRHTSAE